MGLIVELELEAVGAVELPPLFTDTTPVLPGPIEVLDIFDFGYDLL